MHAVSHHRAIRRSVLVTLAAWVLALMVGVANACLLHEHESGPQAQGQIFAHEATHAACSDASEATVVRVVKQQARDGNPVEFRASGFPARVIQHETDHLDGVLFFDRMKSFETLTFLEEFQRYWTSAEDEDEA